MGITLGATEKWFLGVAGVIVAVTTVVQKFDTLQGALCPYLLKPCASAPTAAMPQMLDLQVSMAFSDPNDGNYKPSEIKLHDYLKDKKYPLTTTDDTPPVYIYPNISLPSRKRPFNGAVSRVPKEGVAGIKPIEIQICVVDDPHPPAGSAAFAVLDCVETAGQCTLKKPGDPGWVQLIQPDSPNFCKPQSTAALHLPSLISRAYAEEAAPKVWIVPSLETLKERKDLHGIGYTEFNISGASLPGQKIDGVVLNLRVNDTPVLIDGVKPEYNVLPYNPSKDPSKGLDIKFALQNLDFAGVNGGCDTIEASLRAVSNGEFAGPATVLKRSYVALRDPEPVPVGPGDRKFNWTGNYVRPQDGYDYAVLVNSIEITDLNSKEQMDGARRRMNETKGQVDGLGLTFEGLRVVGVIRPPLTKASFGTALGVVEKTGQIRFTFGDLEKARHFKTVMVEQAQHIPHASAVIRGDAFIRRYEADVAAPKNICPPPE